MDVVEANGFRTRNLHGGRFSMPFPLITLHGSSKQPFTFRERTRLGSARRSDHCVPLSRPLRWTVCTGQTRKRLFILPPTTSILHEIYRPRDTARILTNPPPVQPSHRSPTFNVSGCVYCINAPTCLVFARNLCVFRCTHCACSLALKFSICD